MAKTIDYIALTIITFMLVFVWTGYAVNNLAVACIAAATVSLLAVVTVYYFKKQKTKPYSYDRLALELSVKGNKYLIKLIKTTLKNSDFENGDNYILFDDCILIASFRFSPIGINDIGNIFTLAMDKDRKRIFVMARGVDRKALQVLQTNGIRISVIRIRAIYKYLEKNCALPDLAPQHTKFSFSAFIGVLFARSNTKSYIFSGVILLSVAFLTPLKLYYLIVGSISLLLALLTFTPLGKGAFDSEKLFDKLSRENAVPLPPEKDVKKTP